MECHFFLFFLVAYEEGEFFFLRGMKGANRGGYLEKCPKDKEGVMIWSNSPKG